MKRIVPRVLPDGSIRYVQPYHVCLEGLECAVLCRDDDDYDAFVKIIAVASRRKNVIVVIYTVVSNHSHVTVLASCQEDADAYGEEMKRMASMWISRRYGQRKILRRTDMKALLLDTDWYVRNALAYVPRNALDNGCPVNEYPWSGYPAMFRKEKTGCPAERKGPPWRVRELTRREWRAYFHTGDDLSDVPWLMDADGHLIPDSFCDTEYLEQAFNHDQSYFIRTIGTLNVAEMREKLVDASRTFRPDSDVLRDAEEVVRRWFGLGITLLSRLQKMRVIPYFHRTRKTTVAQLARIFGMKREEIQAILYKV